jgi:hypothetical protein
MAKLLCQVQWDPKAKKVVTTYQVLSVEPTDKIQVTTEDSQPFIIQTRSAKVVKRLGLQKAKNTDGRNDLYQVQPAAPPTPRQVALPRQGPPPTTLNFRPQGPPARTTLNCGTLDEQGHFVAWGPGFPLDN